MSLAGKSVLVVGGAKGIGRATAEAFRAAGAAVKVWDRDVAPLEGQGFSAAVCDICDREQVRGLLARDAGAGVQYRAVVISAGMHATYPAALMPEALLDKVMDVNFASHVKLVQGLVDRMEPDGRIIGVSSIAATVGIPMSAAYSASKAALELFYETLSTELHPRRIWPIIINAGSVNTGFNETNNLFNGPVDDPLTASYAKVVASIDSRYGMPPQAVAKVILAAATVPKPRFRYVVGKNARRADLAKRVLGPDGALFMLRRHFGLN